MMAEAEILNSSSAFLSTLYYTWYCNGPACTVDVLSIVQDNKAIFRELFEQIKCFAEKKRVLNFKSSVTIAILKMHALRLSWRLSQMVPLNVVSFI